MMNKLCYLVTLGLVLGVSVPTAADEGYDPLLYSSEAEANKNLFSILPPTPIHVGKTPSQNTKATPSTTSNNTQPVSASTSNPTEETSSISALPAMSEEDLNFPVEEDNNLDTAGGSNMPPLNYQSQEANAPQPVNTNISLTENLSADKSENSDSGGLPEKVKETWIGKITETAAEKVKETTGEIKKEDSGDSFESLMKRNPNAKKRSNASVFDISGVMLRMNLAQAEAAMKTRRFTKVSVKYEIPNFIKWRNEEKCRNNGVVGYERLASCVVELAKKNNHQYPETVRFSRFDTKEELEIKLTSNFTGNKIYRVLYKSMSPSITGNSNKAIYLRNVKIYDFWKKVNQKYGSPDNKDEVLWGLGGNKAYLKAASGILLLEDPMLRELDYTRMSREDQRFINTDLYNF